MVTMMCISKRASRNGVACKIPRFEAKVMRALLNTAQSGQISKKVDFERSTLDIECLTLN
jgi:hypothetical protein